MTTIRDASVEDVPIILEMLRHSAKEQGFPDSVAVTEEDLRSDGFGVNPLFFVALAEVDGSPAGMALYFYNYSTWGSRLGLYLEDLYVGANFRRLGIGKVLLTHLAQIALTRGCGRFHWVVHTANTSAIRLYEKAGAGALEDWRLMSLTRDGIVRLANADIIDTV